MQREIKCLMMRGGTSKGAYFIASDLPADPVERDRLLLSVMGSPDPRQIDGIGGAHPLTSKVAIVSRSTDPRADIDFLFAQVGVDDAKVDTTANCGNILAGVGPLHLSADSFRHAILKRPSAFALSTPAPWRNSSSARLAAGYSMPARNASTEPLALLLPLPLTFLTPKGRFAGPCFPPGRFATELQALPLR
jgi:hypothetical protein